MKNNNISEFLVKLRITKELTKSLAEHENQFLTTKNLQFCSATPENIKLIELLYYKQFLHLSYKCKQNIQRL